jgi:hypothetical protein
VWGLVGATVFPLTLAAAAFLLVAQPVRRLHTLAPDTDTATAREACHQAIRWFPPAGHDAYIRLAFVGDETSVPRLIRALRWAPDGANGWECTWSHCCEALSAITNQKPGYSYKAWRTWYEANRTKSRLDWIADGFRDAGYEVTPDGQEETVRALLAIAKRHEQGKVDNEPWWFGRNARLLLESCGPGIVRAVQQQLEGTARP